MPSHDFFHFGGAVFCADFFESGSGMEETFCFTIKTRGAIFSVFFHRNILVLSYFHVALSIS